MTVTRGNYKYFLYMYIHVYIKLWGGGGVIAPIDLPFKSVTKMYQHYILSSIDRYDYKTCSTELTIETLRNSGPVTFPGEVK